MADNQIGELTRILTQFTTEFTKRTSKLEANQEHLTSAITDSNNKMSGVLDSVKELLISNNRLETKLVGLEEMSLEKIQDVRKEVESFNSKMDDIDERIRALELHNATKQGEEKAETGYRSFWMNNWYKVLLVIGLAIPALAAFYELLQEFKDG